MQFEDHIAAYLTAIDQSGVFGKSARRLQLLDYLLRAEARGDGGSLKAYTIGVDVFGRPDDFDPALDSSVRVEMGRLRTAIDSFEATTAAQTTPFEVAIPTGSYRPQISKRIARAEPATSRRRPLHLGVAMAAVILLAGLGLGATFLQPSQDRRAAFDDGTVHVAISPFAGDPNMRSSAQAALSGTLMRDPSVTVLAPTELQLDETDFVLRGYVTPPLDARYRIDVELLQSPSEQIVWSETAIVGSQNDLQDVLGTQVASELRRKLLGTSRQFLEGRDISRLSAEQLFIMATWIPGPATVNAYAWEQERISLMEMALDLDPNSGMAHSVLADKLAHMANLYPIHDSPKAAEKVDFHIKRAIELDQFNPNVMFNIGQAHWHSGRIKNSHFAMRRVLDLDPGNDLARFLTMVVPYTCRQAPDDVIQDAISFDHAVSPDNPIRWITLSWIALLHINAGAWEDAFAAKQRARLIFDTPYTFVGEAMALVQMDRTEDATAILSSHSENWPDLSVDHFAEVTIPRLCQENPEGQHFIQNYVDLATAMRGQHP